MAEAPRHSWEIVGWFLYDFANGAFFYGASAYFPSLVTAQALEVAKENFCGACLNNEWAEDFENEGDCSNDSFDNLTDCEANGDEWTADISKNASYVAFFGGEVGYASVFSYCTVLSVVFQLALFLTMGSFADYGPNRKNMFLVFNAIGVASLLVVIFFKYDEDYLANATMYIISTVCFSFCVVFYNAYIPLLVKALPEMHAAMTEESGNSDKAASQRKLKEVEDDLTSSLSLKGLACGFSGQFLFLCGVFVVILFSPTTNNYSTRLAIFLSGIWVLVFSTFTFWLLEKRPGPPLPDGDTYCQHSLNQAYGTFKSFKHLPELGKFMMAYFVFSDGTSTLANASIVFAQVELNFTFVQIGISLLLVSFSAVFGCWAWWKIQTHFKVAQKHVLMLNLALMAIIPLWASGGVKTDIEFYIAVCLFGLNTGSQQAFTRTIYSTLLPYGREAEYFSFYEVSDKGTAWLGPLVLGIVFDATGSFRQAFVYLEIFFILGLILLWFVDVPKALEEKREFDLNHNSYFLGHADEAVREVLTSPQRDNSEGERASLTKSGDGIELSDVATH